MMDRRDAVELAANIIEYGKALAPDRFPKPSELVLSTWGEVLGARVFPPGVWPEALRVWAGELTGERMATPADLVRAARIVVSRWESDPVRRAVLAEHREARRVERDRLLAAGEFAAVRGYRRRELPVKQPVSRDVVERARAVVGLPPAPDLRA